MKTPLAIFVMCIAAASLVASDAAFAKGKGGRSGGGRSAHSGSHHHHHARSRAFVGAFAAVPVWPWWAYAAYAEYAGPVHYIERAEEGEGEWLYCRGAGAYFPQIADCPGGWQSVRPSPAPG